jgi:hypothetical protein
VTFLDADGIRQTVSIMVRCHSYNWHAAIGDCQPFAVYSQVHQFGKMSFGSWMLAIAMAVAAPLMSRLQEQDLSSNLS